MNLMESKQMDGLPELDQAKKAIRHMLNQIRDSPEIGWYCGFGTQAFSLLTEAHSTLWKRDLKETREAFLPTEPKDPKEEVEA